MAVMGTAGTERARFLLNGIPDRFNEFCHMDQITFVHLADWLLEHAECNIPREISIEECLFVFLDIVAQGNSFKGAAYGWDHDVQLTQSIFINILDALNLLHEREEISPSCPSMKAQTSRSRWRVLKEVGPRRKSRTDGMVKIGDDQGDGLEISQESLTQALTALNNFIHERKDD